MPDALQVSPVALISLLALGLFGCGGNDHTTGTAPLAPSAVKRCLQAKGLKVTGGAGRPVAGDTNAADRGELITEGAFIGFYSSPARAEKLAPRLRASNARLHATLVRKGAISVIYLNRGAQPQIDACLRA